MKRTFVLAVIGSLLMTTAAFAQESSAAETRPRISYKQYKNYPCTAETFNTDDQTHTLTYSDSKKRFVAQLPFNGNWGNTKYSVNAFDKISVNKILFGALFAPGEGCGLTREYNMTISLKPKSYNASRLVKMLNNKAKKYYWDWEVSPQQFEVNGTPAIKYKTGGLCSSSHVILVRNTYSIDLSSSCGSGRSIDALVKIANSISFLDAR